MAFEDHFSRLAATYAAYRPGYPEALFDFLAGAAPGRELAWDCGTGNGQAACALAAYFRRVVATDASREQIERAIPCERVAYRVEPAEAVSIPSGTVDLVTVAIAVHWFDLDRFYEEVRRVLQPGGVLAVWGYHLLRVDPAVDRIVERYYRDVVGAYWPERFRYVDEKYETLPFPFAEIPAPKFEISAEWTLDQVAGFLASWSASRRYVEAVGEHPLDEVWDDLRTAWGSDDLRRRVRWELYVRVGRAA
ncbi:MAG TPA: class I SAM-dependent methyltransferase [Rhodothermales bacterium]|nr:class I SAM-dependent methyltransferase [Rhodothermales bacterium]